MKNHSFFFIIFLFLVSSYIALHFYLASFLNRNIFFYKNNKTILLLLALFSVLGLFLKKFYYNDISEMISLLAYIWMGTVLILSFSFFIGDIFIKLLPKYKFILTSITIFISLSFVFKAIYNGFTIPSFKEINIYSSKIKEEKRIIVFSDLHLDFPFKVKLFLKIMNSIKDKKIDYMVFLGDLLDPGFKMNEEYFKTISNNNILKIGILGNHEYYYGLDKSIEVYKKLKIKLLRNQSFQNNEINFIGINDIKTENIKEGEILNLLNENYKKDFYNIILSHQPLYFKELSKIDPFLMLSGHIHKGQIFPFHVFVYTIYKYFYGLYKENNSYLYVTSGVLTWGPPMRFLAKGEIPIIILKPKK